MNNKPNAVDPIPEEFSSYQAAAEFWDTHDTTDYLDDFETVSLETQFQQCDRLFYIGLRNETQQLLTRKERSLYNKDNGSK